MNRTTSHDRSNSTLVISLAALAVLLMLAPPMHAQATCAARPANLVSWFRAEGNAIDAAGSNHGTPQNGATFATGMVGQAFSFDGLDDIIRVPSAPNLEPQQFTLEAWVFARNVGGGIDAQGPVVISKDFAGNVSYGILGPGTTGKFNANMRFTDGTQPSFFSANSFGFNTWHHVAMTWDGNTINLYVNGNLEGSVVVGPKTVVYSAEDLGIGMHSLLAPVNKRPFDGFIDEVEIFNRALSSSEIASAFGAGSAGHCVSIAPPANLVSWYRAEFTAKDSIGSNHGTLQNGASLATGMIGQAFSFDGINDSVNIPAASSLNVGAQATFAFWMRPDPSNPMNACCQGLVVRDNMSIEIANPFGVPVGIIFGASNGGTNVHTSDVVGTGFPVTAGQWHHVVGTYDGTAVRLYVDGLERAAAPLTGTIPPIGAGGFLTIGSEDGHTLCPSCVGTRYFHGMIDDVQIFNRALSSAEVAAAFNAGAAGYIQYDVEIDFNVAMNPNGLWSYGQSATLGSTFTLLPDSNPGSPIESWANNATSGPGISHHTGLSTFVTGSQSYFPRMIGTDPSFSGQVTIARWTAPTTGIYRVSATWEGRDTCCPTTGVTLRHNSTQLFGGAINGFGSMQSFLGVIAVQAGDVLDFNTDSGTSGVTFDLTSVEAIITPVLGADLALTKSDAPDPINLGAGNITYTLTVSNGGAANATNVVLTDTLPANVTFGMATPSQGMCAQAAGVVTCNLGTINNGAMATVAITVTPQAAAGGTSINNMASVTATENDPVAGNNSAAAMTTVNAVAELTVTNTDAPDPVNVGANVTYTVTVSNAGPNNASNVMLSDTLPANSAFVSAMPSQGMCPAPAGGILTCNLGGLASGANANVMVVVTPGAAAVPSITNTASASASEVDTNPADNTNIAQMTAVTPVANLSVTKTDAPDPIQLGSGNITYTITVANAGPSAAASVVLTDTLPAGVTFVSATMPCTQAMGTVTCNLGTINSGANTVITVIITPTASGTLNNTATVTGATMDPAAANNTALASTMVNVAQALDFSISASPTLINVVGGQTGRITVTITPIGGSFTNAIGLACRSVPPVGCHLPMTSVTPGPNPVVFEIMIPTQSGLLPPVAWRWPAGPTMLLWTSVLAVALWLAFSFPLQRRPREARLRYALSFARALLVVGLAMGHTACSNLPVPSRGPYTVTVTGTSGALSHSTMVTINVQ